MDHVTVQFADTPQRVYDCVEVGIDTLERAWREAFAQREAARTAHKEARAAWDKSRDSGGGEAELWSNVKAADAEFQKVARRKSALGRCLSFMHAISSQLEMMTTERDD